MDFNHNFKKTLDDINKKGWGFIESYSSKNLCTMAFFPKLKYSSDGSCSFFERVNRFDFLSVSRFSFSQAGKNYMLYIGESKKPFNFLNSQVGLAQ